LLPVYLILAIMGWFDVPLSMSTLLIGGIVIGVAVDDTIHFMHKFGRHYQVSGDVTLAVQETLSRTGLAILSTSIALIGSFAVYNFGAIEGIRQMGYLVDIAIAIALVADIVLAPALLVVTAKFLYPSGTAESSE
jgi:predicted RND superfamily exporter protein